MVVKFEGSKQCYMRPVQNINGALILAKGHLNNAAECPRVNGLVHGNGRRERTVRRRNGDLGGAA